MNVEIPSNIWTALIAGGLVTGLLSLVGTLIKAIIELTNSNKQNLELIRENRVKDDRAEIKENLKKFYGPFLELRTQSRHLYDIFALTEKAKLAERNEYFRTLRFLADGHSLRKGDDALLCEIIQIGQKQIQLIEKQGWVISNPSLSALLGKLAAHIRILDLAHKHCLDGMGEVVETMVFPLEIDGAIETEIRKLNAELENLRKEAENESTSTIFTNATISEKSSISYYDTFSSKYFSETAQLDLTDIYSRFRNTINDREVKAIPRGGLILDAGCGVGRDTQYFIKHGYRVVSFDASKKMVEYCRQYSFAFCTRNDFENIDFTNEFDGVWACASLVHTPHDKLEGYLSKLTQALKPGGVLFFTLKEGTGSAEDKGRRFYYYLKENVRRLLVENLYLNESSIWTSESQKKSDDLTWLNFLFTRPSIIKKVKGINA